MMLLDQHWYASRSAVAKACKLNLQGKPHLTPDGQAVLVCDYQGAGRVQMVMQGTHGHDLTDAQIRPVTFDPHELPDLERLVEFDHLPEARKVSSWMKAGSKLC